MTTLTAPLLQRDGRRQALLGVVGFVVALAAASQVALPVPGTPVPITLQPMIVVLAGLMLGPTLGAVSMLLYLGVGALGLPVFTPMGAPGIARFLGPTGGYLFAYPAAAFVAGFVAHRAPSLMGRWLGAVLGMVALFIGGIGQLAILNESLGRAVALGITPFAVFDVVKAFVAALIARPRAHRIRD